MYFLVVTTSQIGSAESEAASSELSVVGSARRFLAVEDASLRFASDFMCLRSAVEALRVWLVAVSISRLPYDWVELT